MILIQSYYLVSDFCPMYQLYEVFLFRKQFRKNKIINWCLFSFGPFEKKTKRFWINFCHRLKCKFFELKKGRRFNGLKNLTGCSLTPLKNWFKSQLFKALSIFFVFRNSLAFCHFRAIILFSNLSFFEFVCRDCCIWCKFFN